MCYPLALCDVHFVSEGSAKWTLFEGALLRGDLSFYNFETASQGYFFEVDVGKRIFLSFFFLFFPCQSSSFRIKGAHFLFFFELF